MHKAISFALALFAYGVNASDVKRGPFHYLKSSTTQRALASTGNFTITTAFEDGFPDVYKSISMRAVARWEEIITGDLPDIINTDQTDLFFGNAGSLAYTGDVDDLVVGFVMGEDSAETQNTYAAASVIARRDTDPKLPISSMMTIYPALAKEQLSEDALYPTILHELGHALGIGTLWPTYLGCGNMDLCYEAIAAAKAAGASPPAVAYASGVAADVTCWADFYYKLSVDPTYNLLVETTTGSNGSDCAHWLEQNYGRELMTTGSPVNETLSPLTIVTIGALEDLGYTVDYSLADPWADVCLPGGYDCTPDLTCAETTGGQCCYGYTAGGKNGGLCNEGTHAPTPSPSVYELVTDAPTAQTCLEDSYFCYDGVTANFCDLCCNAATEWPQAPGMLVCGTCLPAGTECSAQAEPDSQNPYVKSCSLCCYNADYVQTYEPTTVGNLVQQLYTFCGSTL